MALLWKKQHGDTSYEVRSAGGSIRLYSNGVFHSQWNPRNVIANALWDLLVVPAFFHAPGRPKRVLVLGLGGGAAVLQLRALFQPSQITCIELDAVHLKIAKRWFGLRDASIELCHADAQKWLSEYTGPPFDYIIDDLFGHFTGEAMRSVAVDSQWANTLCSHLSEEGILVVNFSDVRELARATVPISAASSYRSRKNKIARHSLFSFSHERYHNRIAVLVSDGVGTGALDHRHYWQKRVTGCVNLTASQKRIAAGFRCRRVPL